MAQQLIFTSAVAGLNPGSSGYCTVARSEAMRDAVAAKLEQWSVYTHARSGPQPVVCAHRVLNLRGSIFHVLTRIVDSELDYTGRTNFLAHHLVFQPHEIHGACSPAEVFLNWNGWQSVWQSVPCYLDDASFSLHEVARTTRMPARAWADAAGDAGAAALLLNENKGSAAKSADLVVPAGQEKGLLRLYAESLHLLDPEGENAPAAWAVAFTTWLQGENDPADFRWRGMWPGNTGRANGEVSFDFVNGSIPSTGQNSLGEYARTGTRENVPQPQADFSEYVSQGTAKAGGAGLALDQFAGIARREKARPSARTGATPPEAEQAPNSIPVWVWFIVGCIVPIGIAAGIIIGKMSHGSGAIDPGFQSKPSAAVPEVDQGLRPQGDASHQTGDAIADPAIDPALQENKSKLRQIINVLETNAAAGSSELENERQGELETAKLYLQRPDLSDVEVARLEKLAENFKKRVNDSNRDYAASTVVATIPADVVYVLSGSTATITISDPNNPLKAWLNALESKGSDADGYYKINYTALAGNDSKSKLIRFNANDNNKSLGCIDPAYTFQLVSGVGGRPVASIVINKVPALTELLSFTPSSQASGYPYFHLLLLRDGSGLKIDRRQVIDSALPGNSLRIKRSMVDPLQTRFAHWKDANGVSIQPVLLAQLKGEERAYLSNSDWTIDFDELRKGDQAKRDGLKADYDLAITAAKNEKAKMEPIKASQKALHEIAFTGDAHKVLSDKNKLSDKVKGKEFYLQLRQWWASVCQIELPEVENILPSDAPDRAKAIQESIKHLYRKAETKKFIGTQIHSFADTLSTFSWTQHSAFLDDKWSDSDQERLDIVVNETKNKFDLAEARLRKAPDRSRVDRIWLGTQIDDAPVYLVELADDNRSSGSLEAPASRPSTP